MARVFATFFAIAFIISGALALTAFTLEGTLFTPQTYLQALNDTKLYERLPTVAAQQLSENLSKDSTPSSNLISPEDLQKIFIAALPPADLKAFAEEAVVQIFAYINRETDDPRISTEKLKDSLRAHATEAFFVVIDSKPTCNATQLSELAIDALMGNPTEALVCKPPDFLLNALKPAITTFITFQVDKLPDTITIIPADNAAMAHALGRLRIIRTWLRYAALLPLGCLLIIALLVIRTFKDWLQWWGAPLAITGLITVLGAFTASLFSRVLSDSFVTNILSLSLPVGLGTLIRDLLYAVSAQIWNPLMLNAGLIFILGLAMVISAWFIKTIPARA